MKTMAAPVVRRVRKLPAPLLPKIVLLAPPKTAPMSAPLPACRRTTRTRITHAITWTTVMRMIMTSGLLLKSDDAIERGGVEAGASDERTVGFGLRHERVDVVVLHAATIEDSNGGGTIVAGEFSQE